MNKINAKQWQNKIRDEYYTPRYLVEPLLKYLPTTSVVWCPFDTENSEYVTVLRESGHKVIHSHIVDGKDFFNYEPDIAYDFIISNPPFSTKKDVLERLYQLDKPFALLFGLPSLAYKEIQDIFRNNNDDIQFLFFNRRATFDGNTSSFNSSYFCWGFLPKVVVFEDLVIDFSPSTMEKDRERILSL